MPPTLTLVLVLAATPPDTLIVPLEELVVTGSRAREVLRRAPAAISVVDRLVFGDTRAIGLKDALGFVPGVLVQSRAGGSDVRVAIRGFGARGTGERSNAGNMRGIRVLSDGIPLTEPDGRTALDLVDLGLADRVEVSRSNASALYGNASGGVVNLRTNLDFAAPWVELRTRAGSFNYHREQLVFGFTAGTARGLASLATSDFAGWRAHSRSAVTQMTLRLAAPLGDGGRLGLLLDGSSTLNRFPGPLTRAEFDADPRQAHPRFVARDERRFHRVGRVGLTLERPLGEAQDLSLQWFVEPKVLQRSERDRFRDFNRHHLGGSATWRLRATLAPGLENVSSVGVDEAWQDGSILFYLLGPGGSRGTELKANKREGANSAGGFVQEELRWHDRWAARFALRFDHQHYLSEDRIEPRLDASRTFTRFTPKASLAWNGDRHTIWAALGGGVEAPAFNEIAPPPPFDTLTSFNPFLETMRSSTWELGARGEFAAPVPGRLRYDAALFWIGIRNDLVPWDGGAYFLTAGRSRRRGGELGLTWTPVQVLALSMAATVIEAEYLEYQSDRGDFAGREVAGIPRATASAAARWNAPAGLSAEVSLEGVGRYFADDPNSEHIPAFALLHATLGWSAAVPAGTLRAFVAGQNLADRRHVASVFINGVDGEYFEPGLPRSWSSGLTLRFR